MYCAREHTVIGFTWPERAQSVLEEVHMPIASLFKRKRLLRAATLPLLLIGISVALLLAACAGAQGPAGPAGATGPAGAAGSKPSAEEIKALIAEALQKAPATVAQIARGGRLYDNWVKETKAAAPAGNQPLWALQTTNTRTGIDTWRCKECHGWDYKGKGGAYSKGSHYTGFVGVWDAGTSKNQQRLVEILKGPPDSRHD